jgi:uncharacterized protein YwqG
LAASKKRVAAAIEKFGLKGVPTLPSLGIEGRHDKIDALDVITSHLGGEPDLPVGTIWPRVDNAPMTFLGQFRLDEVNESVAFDGISTSGLLSLFALIESDGGYPPKDDGVFACVFPIEGLQRHPNPKDLDEEMHYISANITLHPFVSVPPLEEMKELLSTASPMEGAESDCDESQDELEDVIGELLDALEPDGTDHRLFGYPSSIQGYGAAANQRLLFQLDADPILGTSFGDGGRLHIWIPTDVPFLDALQSCTISCDSG